MVKKNSTVLQEVLLRSFPHAGRKQKRGFLTVIYVILSLSFMEYILAYLVKRNSEIWINLMRIIKNSIVRQYENKKLKGI